jgi:hypothetical protein
MLKGPARSGSRGTPVGSPSTTSPVKRAAPTLLLVFGFLLSSGLLFLTVYVVGGVVNVEYVPARFRYGAAGASILALLVVDVVNVARARLCSLGPQRQTPRAAYYQFGAYAGALVWGLDTGLAVTTIRVTCATWALLVLTVLHLVPPYAGLAYGAAFAVPLAIAILAPQREAGDTDQADAGLLHMISALKHRRRAFQSVAIVLMLVQGAGLLLSAL